jgi:hypothetical protein
MCVCTCIVLSRHIMTNNWKCTYFIFSPVIAKFIYFFLELLLIYCHYIDCHILYLVLQLFLCISM